MAIFGNRSKSYVPATENVGFIQPTNECFDQIITESAKDSYQLRAGMYISDVMMEEAVLESAADPEVLLEAFGKGVWAKIKEMFSKLWAKIKEWYNKFKRMLAIIFTSGSDFVKKFEKELRGKTAKGFKYTTFKYTYDAGGNACAKNIGIITMAMDTYRNGVVDADVTKSDSHHDALDKNKSSYKAEYNTADEKEELLKKLGGDSVEEVMEEVQKAFRNGEDTKEEFEDFSSNSKEYMMSFIKEKDKALKEVEKEEQKVNTEFDKIIKAIDKAANKFKGDDYSKVSPYVSHATEMLRFGATVLSSLSKVEADCIKEMAREFEAILKHYLTFKPVKEGFDGDANEAGEGAESILEAAMKYV